MDLDLRSRHRNAPARGGHRPGTLDNASVIEYVRSTSPTASYVVASQPFPKSGDLAENYAWVDNTNLTGAFHHPKAVVRSEIPVAKFKSSKSVKPTTPP